jgi:hypothetical protein
LEAETGTNVIIKEIFLPERIAKNRLFNSKYG